ncbi:MAG: hypothetical protein QF449_09940 [Alphaproteobacteria bacterium]|jgi:hypothetical protein|nr:hypothetical protein [Alphaproteobacteria bacterium]
MILSGINHQVTRRLAPLAVAALIVVAGWHAASAQADDPVAATVNGETITRNEIMLALELVPAQFRNMPPEQLFQRIREQADRYQITGGEGRRERPRRRSANCRARRILRHAPDP